MLKQYQNELLHVIQELGVDLNSIKKHVSKDNGEAVVVIKFNGTPFEFTIKNSPDSFTVFYYKYIQFKPHYPESHYEYCPSFDSLKNTFINWFRNHTQKYIEESKTPDLWEQLQSERKIVDLSAIDFGNREYFNLEEKQQIKLALNDVKLLIVKAFSPTSEEMHSVNARIHYLSESLERLNKFDWKSLLFSTIASIAIALSLDTSKGKQLFHLFKQAFEIIPKLLFTIEFK